MDILRRIWKSKNYVIVFACLFTLFVCVFLQGGLAKTLNKPESIGILGADKAIVHGYGYSLTCYEYPRYYVVEEFAEDDLISDIFVTLKVGKRKIDIDSLKKESYYELRNLGAGYFLGIYGYLLFIDVGTDPCDRGLIIHDLSLKKKVYVTNYNGPILIENNKLSFWRYSAEAHEKNCPEYNKITQHGNEAVIEKKVILDLKTLVEIESYEKRCAGRH